MKPAAGAAGRDLDGVASSPAAVRRRCFSADPNRQEILSGEIHFGSGGGEMSKLRCSPATAPPLDDDDLLSEILLRLPPQPSSLPHASLVCRRWRSLLSGPGFARRFRLHHRRDAPLLGFFVESDSGLSFLPTMEGPDRVPPGRFSSSHLGSRCEVLGYRHGLVLFFDAPGMQVLVWDPVTADQSRIALPPGFGRLVIPRMALMQGTVLRAAAAAGDVQHFQMVLAVADLRDKSPAFTPQAQAYGETYADFIQDSDSYKQPSRHYFASHPG